MKIVNFLIYLYFILFPFGQLLRIPPQSKSYSEIHFYLTDLAVALIVLFWLVYKIKSRKKIGNDLVIKPLFLYSFLAFLSLILSPLVLSGHDRIAAFLYLVRWIFYAGLYFVIRDLPLSGQEKIKKNMPLVGLGCALLGLIQYCFLPDTRFIAEYGWDPHYFRLVGTFLDPGFLGMIFVFTLIMITLRLWSEKTLFNYLAWMIVYVALALTYSRASYFAYITSMGIIALRKRTIKFFAAILVVGIITIFLLPRAGGESTRLERESTIRFRITSWQHALIIARDHPLLGIGFNAYRNAQRQYNFFDDKFWEVSHGAAGADSSLLFVLATTGLVGLASFLYLGYEVIKQAKGDLLINASLGGLFIHSFFLNSLFYPWVMAWMWICIGFTHAPKPPIRKSKNDPHLA